MLNQIPEDYYKITEKGNTALNDMKRRANNNNGKNPSYEEIDFQIENVDEFLFWYYLEYKRLSVKYPTEPLMVDRINNMGPYTMKNIQLLPLSINEIKKAEDHALEYVGRIPKKREKYCNKCKSIKLRSEFYVDRKELDGLHAFCKECSRSYKK